VLGGAVAVREEPGGLEHDVNAQVLPRQLRRIAQRQHLELVAVDRDRIARGRHLRVQIAEHRVVLQKMRQRCSVREVVDGDEVDVLVGERRAHDIPTDPAKPVNANFDRHPVSSRPCPHHALDRQTKVTV